MDEGRENNQVQVDPRILGPRIFIPHVYLVTDKQNPHYVCRTTVRADAITFAGSQMEH